MTRVTPTPKHGTLQRYRLELREQKAGRGKGPCDRCKSANNERARAARANRNAGQRRAQLSIVGDVTPEGHTDAAPEDDEQFVDPREHTSRARGGKPRHKGQMEIAVEKDLASIDENMRVPFHNSLTVLALETAREIDEPATAATARRDARKQLFDVLRSLRTQKEGGDDSALTVLLQDRGFGTPLVPGRPA